jgi:hypothetical protein
MPDEFDSDAFLTIDDTALSPIQPEPEPEYSAADVAGLIEYERERDEFASPCKCGRSIRRGRQCYLCWTDELTRRTL